MNRHVLILLVLVAALLVSNALWLRNSRANAATVKNAEAAIRTLPSGKYFVGTRGANLIVYCVTPVDTLTVETQLPRAVVVACKNSETAALPAHQVLVQAGQ
jgi:hypothetical protein